jgi:hypothetical protein
LRAFGFLGLANSGSFVHQPETTKPANAGFVVSGEDVDQKS